MSEQLFVLVVHIAEADADIVEIFSSEEAVGDFLKDTNIKNLAEQHPKQYSYNIHKRGVRNS